MTDSKPKLLILTCAYEECGQPFEWVKKRGKVPEYCSPKCRVRAFHRRNPGYQRRRYRDVIAPGRKAERASQPPRVFGKDQPCAEDCGSLVGLHGARGRCNRCNIRLKRAELKTSSVPCGREGCGGFVRAPGQPYCDMHRARLRRDGEVGPAESLHEKRGTWHTNKNGYRMTVVNRREVYEHRAVMEKILGRPLESFEHVHHKNGQRADNRPENLELWATPGGRRQPYGQRVEDLVSWVVYHYPDLAEAEVRKRKREKRSGQDRLIA